MKHLESHLKHKSKFITSGLFIYSAALIFGVFGAQSHVPLFLPNVLLSRPTCVYAYACMQAT